MLKTFRALKAAGEFRKRHLPFIRTFEDQELIREIGLGQAIGEPLSLKQLFLHGIASVATVQRRLARLRRLGVVEQIQSVDDKRVVKLTLSPSALRSYRGWGQAIRRSWR
jgi:DNA-binding MarR family transcriptional regulator